MMMASRKMPFSKPDTIEILDEIMNYLIQIIMQNPDIHFDYFCWISKIWLLLTDIWVYFGGYFLSGITSK